MLGYRNRSFARAHDLLNIVRTNHDDLEALKALQQLLCGELVRAESKIRKLKSELNNTVRTGGGHAAKRSSYLRNRIEGLRQCAYVWRCFGDAIAFTYMDKFALKQCFYNTENSNVRQGAGFIADKAGFPHEIYFLEFALKEQVPALLVDLTNTIRYGDVCLMDASDPQLFEVKATKKLDRRGKKQKRSLKKLQDFFETDKAVGLRGFPDVRRAALEVPERTHVAELNACIGEALNDGHAVTSPERGLSYVVIRTRDAPRVQDVLCTLRLKEPWVFDLNQVKIQRACAPYLPFILTIEDKDYLWKFIRGELYILVFIELGTLSQIAVDNGYEAQFDRSNADYPLRINVPGTDNFVNVSSHMLARIGFEFLSPEWPILAAIEALKHGVELGKAGA